MARHCTLGGVAHIEDVANYRTDIQVAEGFLDGIHEVRGEDDVLPYVAGRLEGDYIEDWQEIVLEGFLRGKGATVAAAQANYWARAAVLSAAWKAAMLNGVTLDVELAGMTGDSYAATVKVRAVMPGPLIAGYFRRFQIVCDSIVIPVWTAS